MKTTMEKGWGECEEDSEKGKRRGKRKRSGTAKVKFNKINKEKKQEKARKKIELQKTGRFRRKKQ